MTFKFKKPEDSPGFLLWKLTNDWQRQQKNALSKLKITHAQFVVLAGLFYLSKHSENPVTQAHISALTQIDKMSMSDLILILLTKKLLKKSPHKKDKRAYELNLTSKGHTVILKAIPIVEKIDQHFFSRKTRNLVLLMENLYQKL